MKIKNMMMALFAMSLNLSAVFGLSIQESLLPETTVKVEEDFLRNVSVNTH